ncbi:MAG: HlyC/CorC family transporter [Alphaproteobacteria bacterium]|nr:HlyC/CorC family transporter [Alphaproteobacteria bacterium]
MEEGLIKAHELSTGDFIISASITVVLMLFSAFFAGSETAMTGASRARMHQLEKDGEPRAKAVNWLLKNREQMVGTMLLGNTFVNIAASALVTSVLLTIFGSAGIAAATIVTTALVLIFCEVLPKTYAIANSDGTALWLGRAVKIAVTLFSPVVQAVAWIVALILKAMGVKSRGLVEDEEEAAEAAHEELRGAIDLHHIHGAVGTSDRNMLGGILDLKDLEVADVMIHRKNMVMIDGDLPPEEVLDRVLSQQHTRLPIYKGDTDNIIGVLHAKDLLRALSRNQGNIKAVNVTALAAKPWFIPDATPLGDQLRAFLQRRTHFALVVDEYGALQGLITLEDILEEIVGDIRDEHDLPVSGIRPQPDGTTNVDGWVTIRDLNHLMNWNLPDEEATTIAGLVIHEAQAIPDIGQVFSFHGFKFEILRRQRNQITALRVSPQ